MFHVNKPSRIFASLLLCAALASPAMASPHEGKGPKHKTEKSHGKDKYKQKHKQDRHDSHHNDQLVVVVLSAADARRIAYNHQAVGYSSLPPGIRKNLARGKPLPPGIAKRGVPAPVLAQLPAYPGYEWQVAGNDLILVSLATAVIAEVLNGVFN